MSPMPIAVGTGHQAYVTMCFTSYQWSLDNRKPGLYLLVYKCLITSSGNGLGGVSHQSRPITLVYIYFGRSFGNGPHESSMG